MLSVCDELCHNIMRYRHLNSAFLMYVHLHHVSGYCHACPDLSSCQAEQAHEYME